MYCSKSMTKRPKPQNEGHQDWQNSGYSSKNTPIWRGWYFGPDPSPRKCFVLRCAVSVGERLFQNVSVLRRMCTIWEANPNPICAGIGVLCYRQPHTHPRARPRLLKTHSNEDPFFWQKDRPPGSQLTEIQN